MFLIKFTKPLIVCEGHPEAAIIIIIITIIDFIYNKLYISLWTSSSVEGESRRRQAATPLADETEDVLTLWTVSGLQGEDGHKQQPIRQQRQSGTHHLLIFSVNHKHNYPESNGRRIKKLVYLDQKFKLK